MIQPLWKVVWRYLKKLYIKAPYDPATPLLGIYPEETKIEKDTQMANKHGKMFNITHHERNANQNYNEVPSHAGQNGCYQKAYK